MFNRKNRSERNVAVLDLGGKVAIGGGDHACVDANGMDAAHALELVLLQHAQKLYLDVERQLTDFIEKDRSAIGELEASLLLLHGAGERPALMSKELALDQGGRQGAAIHFDHDRAFASTRSMNRTRDQLLARSSFAKEQHGRISFSDELDSPEDLLHRRRAPEDLAEVEVSVEGLTQIHVLTFELVGALAVRDVARNDHHGRLVLGAIDPQRSRAAFEPASAVGAITRIFQHLHGSASRWSCGRL